MSDASAEPHHPPNADLVDEDLASSHIRGTGVGSRQGSMWGAYGGVSSDTTEGGGLMARMTKLCVGLFALIVGTVGGALGASPAWAAPPANDNVAGAVVIGSIPFHYSQSTVDAAQTDPFETSLNESCGAPQVEHGVWFTAIATADGFVTADVSGSDYSAGVMVFLGTPTASSLVLCGPGMVSGPVTAGTTYYILVFGDGLSAATSGTLVLDVRPSVPPPDIQVTVDRSAQFNRQGVVRLTGTVTCTSTDGSGTVFDVSGTLTQRVGRLKIEGFFDSFLDAPCDGSTIHWEAFVEGQNGIFRGGKAATFALAFGCTEGGCNQGFTEAVVQLQGGLK